MTSSGPFRNAFYEELDQIRLQVELVGVRVDHNLDRMREVLRTGDEDVAKTALRADDEIDAMHVSLLERCYGLLGREAPVASDLRFVASVVRILSELERVGDLALRVGDLADELSSTGEPWDVLLTMVDTAVEQYRTALRAWSAQDLGLASQLADHPPSLLTYHERLLRADLYGRDQRETLRLAIGAVRHRSGGRPHRRPRHHHRRPAALPADGRADPPRRRGSLTMSGRAQPTPDL